MVIGGAGNDVINTGAGDDVVFGDSGRVVAGDRSTLGLAPLPLDARPGDHDRPEDRRRRPDLTGSGNDVALGGNGADVLVLGAGDDIALGDHGALAYSDGRRPASSTRATSTTAAATGSRARTATTC